MERKDHITSTGYHLHSSPHFLYVEQLNLSCFFWLEGWEHIFYAFFYCRGTQSDGIKNPHTSWNAQRSDTFRLVNDGKHVCENSWNHQFYFGGSMTLIATCCCTLGFYQ